MFAAFSRKYLPCALVLSVVSIANGQFVRGTLQGVVTDAQDAVIAGATVTLQNLATNESRIVQSDSKGEYLFPSLLPGKYSISATAQGFKTRVIDEVELQVNQTARIDLKLPVGEVSERVEVMSSPVLLKTDTSEIGHVVTNKQIVELPLNGRDYLQLARLIPSATPSRAGATLALKGVNRSVNVSGARDTSVGFLLDGVDSNDVAFQTPSVTPSIDAIQEFKVLQNAYSAEFGRGATQIITALKTGTNQTHGSLFEFLRLDKLAARSFFQPGPAALLKQNQFGATLGSRVDIPKIYDGKDKTFFFINYEGQRIRTGTTTFTLVPTPAELSGNFSGPGEALIYDPQTFDPATRLRQPFPGNRIPSTQFSARGVKAAGLFPAPNISGLTGRNYISSPAQNDDNNQGNARVDHRVSDKDSTFARYSILDRFRTQHGTVPLTGTVDNVRGQNVALNWVHVFRPTLLNEVRVGFNRNKFYTVPDGSIGANPAQEFFGFTNTTTNPTTAFGLPAFAFSGGIAGLGASTARPANSVTQTEQVVENLTWIRGSHALKAGFDIRHSRLSQIVANNDRGSFTFTGQFTNQPGATGTGNSVADLLLGYPQSAAAAAGDSIGHFFNEMQGYYFQDDWKISPRLTLNLGVRYEYISPYTEKLNQLTVVDPDYPAGRLLIGGTTKAFVPGQGVVDIGEEKVPRSILRPDRNNWAPRVGLAWRPIGKTVFRSGYGVFYDVQEGNEATFMRFNPPFFFIQNLVADPFLPTLRLEALFPPASGSPSGVIQPFSVDPTGRIPYIQQWNANIERELAPNLLFEIGYLGSKATHLLRRSNFQQGSNILVQDPAHPTPIQSRVRYPNFSPNLILGTDNGGSSTYHGLIAKLERRFSNGFSFLASYTFSKTIDDTHSSSNFDNTPQNPQCRCEFGADKGLSAFDTRQRAVFSYNYEFPFGPGKAFLSRGGAMGKVIGGWQVNGITALQTGPPFTLNTVGDNANIGTGSGSSNNQRPNLVGDPYAGIDKGASIQRRGVDAGTYYFNRAAYAMPPLFQLGNVGKNTLIGPGFQNWDFSVFKNTSITERVTTQFRAEFFNIFNQAAFAIPGRLYGTPTLGLITAAGPGRIIQFGLKVIF